MNATGLATLLACLATSVACGSSFDDVCTKQTNCLGGNDKDKQVCVDAFEAQKKEASDYGCSQQFSDWQTCYLASFSCNNGNNCQAQQTKIGDCIAGASGIKGAPGH